MTLAPVFVSTGSFGIDPLDAVQQLRHSGVTRIELSGGVFSPKCLQGLIEEATHGPMQLHNYFPPPKEPFVFNLCDPNPSRRTRSLEFAQKAIDFGLKLGSTTYSFHAGFLGTPAVSDLGKAWGVTQRICLDEGMDLFAQSVHALHTYARERGVKLLVENNVLTTGTAQKNGGDVLLMVSPESIRNVLASLPEEVELLMDVAHLAVSARTLGFDANQALRDLVDVTRAYHISENDGFVDSNQPIRQDSWFWGGLDSGVEFVTLEVDPNEVASLAAQVELAEAMLSCPNA